MRRVPRIPPMVAAVVAALLSALLAPAEPSSPSAHPTSLRVMTRNVYVGGDITRPIRAASGKTGQDALLALGHANSELRAIVDQTDFPVRGRLLAREITGTRPDAVGLQEVAQWRHGPMELNQLGVLNATEVDYDFLATLLADLAAAGARYRVASAQTETDVEAPAFLGNPFTGTATDARDVRLTVRDVVLVRGQAGVQVEDHGGGSYAARLNVDLAGLNVSIVRGYAWVDLRRRGTRVRVITTHLESISSDLALAQAHELLSGPGQSSRPVVIACDCNSDPLNSNIKPADHVPHYAPYRFITGSGWTDEWSRLPASAGAGWTAGLSELVNDPTAAGFDHRIDMIFGRGTRAVSVRAASGQVTSNTVTARDPATGLWPSDHAGLVITLALTRHHPD
jgi:endonuclease/exonuclease/phosphatase family metal-dependent hydrolase